MLLALSLWASVALLSASPSRLRCGTPVGMVGTISRDAPAPVGPDPYKLVASDLDHIKSSIKKVLSDNRGGSGALSKNEVLTMAAREFMQRKGKSFRPMVVLLVGRATNPDFAIGKPHYKLAVIAEMIHTASLIHADVLEEDETDTSQGTLVHQEVALDVGNKVCILAGDFLLAKAAVELSLLDHAAVTEIVARGLESICEGGMLAFDGRVSQSYADNASLEDAQAEGADEEAAHRSVSEHLHILGRGTAQLIGNSCQCAAILSGHDPDSPTATACLEFGEGLAMAQQLVGEAEAMESLLKKKRRAVKTLRAQGQLAQSTPLLIAVERFPELNDILKGGFRSDADATRLLETIERANAVARTQEIATEYTQRAVDALALLPPSDTRDALRVLCHKVLTGASIKP